MTQKGSNAANARVRTFQYDPLSHLTQAANPESGTIYYAYDADGNAVTKTAPLPNQTASSQVTTTSYFDKLNRLTKKTYNDGSTPTVQFQYDATPTLSGCATTPPSLSDQYPIGRRTQMCDGSGAASWSHDPMGRVAQETRTIGAATGENIIYSYNKDGSLATLQTPPLKTITYTPNGASRSVSAIDSGDSVNFAQNATYAPPGELAGATLGAASNFTGFTVSNAYNDRLQPILLSATNSQTATTVFGECFNFNSPIAVTTPLPCSFAAGSGDNGNVWQIVNNRTPARSQNFLYDPLNRIWQAYTTGSAWGETFSPNTYAAGTAFSAANAGIDAWGNLTNESGVTGKTLYGGLSTSAGTNNQLAGYGYDAAGNMTSNGSTSYVYDAENRLAWTNGLPGQTADRYIYDGDGERVEKCQAASATTACPTSGTTGTLYFRGTGSDTLDETDLAGNTQEEYIYFNGQRIARRDVSSSGATVGLHYYFSDHLGSHAVVETVTTSGGTNCDQDIDYYPYGGAENDYCSSSSVPQHYKFTGKERDAESGLDNFGARYNASSMGRFMTPDPGNAGVVNADPQSWNAYAYVRNTPVNLTDPTGAVFCRPANSTEQGQGISQVCDVTDTQFFNFSKETQAAYEQAGYRHYDCSCDTESDKAAWSKNNTVSNDWVGDALIFIGVLAGVRAIESGIEPPVPPRNPNDKKRQDEYPNPPSANNGNSTIGTNPNQAAKLAQDIQQAQQEGATDIRVNQEQVNAQGVRVGQNRPDLQYTDRNGIRHYVEYDQDPASGAAHAQRIRANDPAGIVEPKTVK